MNLLGLGLSQSRFSPRKLRPSLYLSADRSVYQDAAVQFTAADASSLQIAPVDQIGLSPGTDDFLICCWVWIDSFPQSYNCICGAGNVTSGADGGYRVYVMDSGKLRVQFGDGSVIAPENRSPEVSITTGAWHFVAMYADRDGELMGYVNGEKVVSVDISNVAGNCLASSHPFTAGMSPNDVYFLDGRLDSLMVFRAADLSPYANDIIAWAYNGGSGRLCAEITDEQKATWGAVSGWEMAEPSGQRKDSWGTNHLDQQFGEILTNGGFEDYTGTLDDGQTDSFTNWATYHAAEGIIEATATAHSGGVALKITNINGVSRIDLQHIIPVVPGATYTLSMYVRGDGTNPPWYRISNHTGSTPVISPSTDTTGITGTSYQLFTKTFTSPADCTSILLCLYGSANEAGSVVYFDDVSLKRESILRAPGIVRAIAANGDGVSYWQDQSTGGKHAAQITLAKRPTLVTSGINSRPVIRGDGVDDYLGHSAISLTGAFAISAVFQSEANPSALTLLGKDANNYIALTDNTTVTVGIAGASQAFTVSAIGTDPHILTVTRDESNAVNVYLDGTVSTTGAKTVAGTLALEQIMAHGSEYFAGDLAEVLVYDGAKSAAELARLHTFLARRYGITI